MTMQTPAEQLEKLISASLQLRIPPKRFLKLQTQLLERLHLKEDDVIDVFLGKDDKVLDGLKAQYLVGWSLENSIVPLLRRLKEFQLWENPILVVLAKSLVVINITDREVDDIGSAVKIIIESCNDRNKLSTLSVLKSMSKKDLIKIDDLDEKSRKFIEENKILEQRDQSINKEGPTETLKEFKSNRVFRMLWFDRNHGKVGWETQLLKWEGDNTKTQVIFGLITASFDCFTSATMRNEKENKWKTVITKRIPMAIKRLAVNCNQTQLENSIASALTGLSHETISLIKSRQKNMNEIFMDEMFPAEQTGIRYELIKELVALNLVSEQLFEKVDKSFGTPVVPRIDQDALQNEGIVAYLNGNSTRFSIIDAVTAALQENAEYVPFEESNIVRLFSNFKQMDSIHQERLATEILKLLENWVQSGSTRSISRFCQALALSPDILENLLLFVDFKQMFDPLVRIIDEWKHDEDEINFQEVYTDFGCILLMVILAHERYQLELPSDSVAWNMIQIQTITQNDLLGGWVLALFDTSGISDDLMRVSSVKELYTLVPTIFSQAVVACSSKIIDVDTLKGGLEYFLQPFLLPSLLGAFRWICDTLWRKPTSITKTILFIVQILLLSDLEGDALRIQRIVLNIVAPELYLVLSQIAASGQDQLFVEPRILSFLDQFFTPPKRDVLISSISSSEGILASFRKHVVVFSKWIVEASQVSPPAVNLPDFVSRVKMEVGSETIVNMIFELLKEHSGTMSDFDITLEILVTVIILEDLTEMVKEKVTKLMADNRDQKNEGSNRYLLKLVSSLP